MRVRREIGIRAGRHIAMIAASAIAVARSNNGTDGAGANSADAVKTYVDANIQIAPLTATNHIGVTHTFTAHVNVNSGTGGFLNAPDGTQISFTTDSGPGAFTSANVLMPESARVTMLCPLSIAAMTKPTLSYFLSNSRWPRTPEYAEARPTSPIVASPRWRISRLCAEPVAGSHVVRGPLERHR